MQLKTWLRRALPFQVLLVAVVLTITITGIQFIRQAEAQQWQAHFLDLARGIAAGLDHELMIEGDQASISNLLTAMAQSLQVDITLMDPTGKVLASSLSMGQLPDNPRDLPAVASAISEEQGTTYNQQVIAAAVSIRAGDGQRTGILQIQAPAENYRISLTHVYWLAAGVTLLTAVITLFIRTIIDQKTHKRIETLADAAQQISMGHYQDLELPEPTDLLQPLIDAFKIMAVRLEEQIENLTSERAMLSSVFNQMTDGVLITSTEGRVQLINPAAERLFNVSQSTVLGRSIVEVVRYHQLVDLWRLAKDGDRQSTMLEIGPQHIFLQAVGIPLSSSMPGSTMLLIQDLTQLRRLETVRRDFISNVSHELRTPLASMKALAETLQETALEDPPAARRFILRMDTEIESLTQLVNELLELSRIESGKVPLSFHRANPCDLIQPAYERMILQVERAGLELVLDCPAELPAVFADPDRITQVLINLVHNAIKFTPPGGKITLSAYQDGDQIIFMVRDTGVGIEKDELNRIFERFYKADRARTGGGMGLGLSIARHMIESHGGNIWAESAVGEGATFSFSLPVA